MKWVSYVILLLIALICEKKITAINYYYLQFTEYMYFEFAMNFINLSFTLSK